MDSPSSALLPSVEAARTLLAEVAQGFYAKNWMLGTSGNLSLRIAHNPLQYLITGSGLDKGNLSPDDLVLLGECATRLAPSSRTSSAESLIHEALYRFLPKVNAVYHVHTVAATVLSMQAPAEANGLPFADMEMLKGLGFSTHDVAVRLPMVNNTQDIASLAVQLPEIINPTVPGLMLRGHGFYAWGESPFEAKRHLEIWEFLFQCRLKASYGAVAGWGCSARS